MLNLFCDLHHKKITWKFTASLSDFWEDFQTSNDLFILQMCTFPNIPGKDIWLMQAEHQALRSGLLPCMTNDGFFLYKLEGKKAPETWY